MLIVNKSVMQPKLHSCCQLHKLCSNMKSLVSICLIIVFTFQLCSCNKDAVTNNGGTNTIINKWHVVSDAEFVGVGLGNHLANYTGLPGDYFDFRANGKLYIKEGAVLDTLNYNLISDTLIAIVSFGIELNGVPTSHLTKLTASDAIINTPVVLTPGGAFGRNVILNR